METGTAQVEPPREAAGTGGMWGIDRTTFNRIRRVVYEKSGIALGEQKEALVCARLGKRMRSLGIADHRSYLKYVMQDESGQEMVHLLDAISTNVTGFFREEHHFTFVQEAVMEWAARGQRRFRLWSAACSTGEEAYSLAITLLEALKGHDADIKILATDLSTKALQKCASGLYAREKLEGIPRTLRERYFEEEEGQEDTLYRVRNELKRLVVFRRINLSVTPYPLRGPLDVVLCRNVMIYFGNEVRRRVLEEMYRLIKPGGYLLVGHAESLTGMMSAFRTVRPSVYRK